jgi:hypothetical protein
MALDEEWLALASLAGRYGEAAADAVLDKDRAERELEVIYANLDHEARTTPTMWPKVFGSDKKPNEDAIANWARRQSVYQVAQEAFHEARHKAKLAAAAVRAIDVKDRSLEWLTKLFLNGYFVGPKVPKEISKRFLAEESASRGEDAQRAALRQRRRREDRCDG